MAKEVKRRPSSDRRRLGRERVRIRRAESPAAVPEEEAQEPVPGEDRARKGGRKRRSVNNEQQKESTEDGQYRDEGQEDPGQ